jgi:plasmid stabilization system protein ParE
VIIFDSEAVEDLERIFEFNAQIDPAIALEHVQLIRSAVQILDTHPEIGRLASRELTLRELVTSYGKTGYIAMYEYSSADRAIRVVAIRHQREAGYRGR